MAASVVIVVLLSVTYALATTKDARPASTAIGAQNFPLTTPFIMGPGSVTFGGTATYAISIGSLSKRTLRGVQMSIPAFQLKGGQHPRFQRRGDELVANLPPVLPDKAQFYTVKIAVPKKPAKPRPNLQLCFTVIVNFRGDRVRWAQGQLCSAPK
jgi:hypothetical protein